MLQLSREPLIQQLYTQHFLGFSAIHPPSVKSMGWTGQSKDRHTETSPFRVRWQRGTLWWAKTHHWGGSSNPTQKSQGKMFKLKKHLGWGSLYVLSLWINEKNMRMVMMKRGQRHCILYRNIYWYFTLPLACTHTHIYTHTHTQICCVQIGVSLIHNSCFGWRNGKFPKNSLYVDMHVFITLLIVLNL